MSFHVEKRQHLAKLAAARAEGRADADALPVLDLVNARADAYTTSSCAGRVQLLALPRPGDKPGSRVLGRWHHAPTVDALSKALAAHDATGVPWVFAEPPIFHVEARTLETALALRRLAEDAGFKRATLKEVRAERSVLVEWASTERLETPVADADHLAFLHPYLEDAFARGRRKLARVRDALEQDAE